MITPPTVEAAVCAPVTLVLEPVITPPTTLAAVTRPVALILAPVLTLPVPFGVSTILLLLAVVRISSWAESSMAPLRIKLPPVILPVETDKLAAVTAPLNDVELPVITPPTVEAAV